MEKEKVLFILHYSPPVHGASKVGDMIRNSSNLKQSFDCHFVKIKSSNSISEIGKFNVKKIWLNTSVLLNTARKLIQVKPDKVYFTPQPSGIPFYRDFLVSEIIKLYKRVFKKSIKLFYHYHSKGANAFAESKFNRTLFKRFLKGANVILLDKSQLEDFNRLEIQNNNCLYFLPNGIDNNLSEFEAEKIINRKYKYIKSIKILYLSNMIKEKGYYDVLETVKEISKNDTRDIVVNFAGSWVSESDKIEFNRFIKQNNLSEIVKHWGFADEILKHKLLSESHIIFFPTKYSKETFGLVVLEALQYGVIPLTYSTAALPNIVSKDIGIVTRQKNSSALLSGFYTIKERLLTKETAYKCSKEFFSKYTKAVFENNLIKVLQNKSN